MRDPIFIRFDTIPACDGQMDRQLTQRQLISVLA